MGSAFHQLCPRYSGTLTPTAPTAIRLWDTFTFFLFIYIYFILFLNHFKDNKYKPQQITAKMKTFTIFMFVKFKNVKYLKPLSN